MNFNDNFDLKKAKSFLLTENYQIDEMASFYSIKPGMEDEAKEAIATVKAKYRPGTAFYQTLDSLEKTGEVDYKALAKETGKDIATWNKPETRNVLEKDGPLAQYLDALSSPNADQRGAKKKEKGEEAPASPAPKAAAVPSKPKADTIKITTPKTPAPVAPAKERDVAQELKDLKAKMQGLSAKYKAGDESALEKLKPLTAKLKQLNKEAGI